MTKSSAPSLTHSPARVGNSRQKNSPQDYAANPGTVTLGLAMNMAWQMAIIVIVPILVGHFLDDHFNASPVYTLIGLAVAMVGMIVVVRQTLKQLNKYMQVTENAEKHGV